jgi:acetylglutamate kinase
LEDSATLDATLEDLVFMETVGLRPILIHGGGKAITEASAKAGLKTQFVQGRRFTDEATMRVVADVLANEINADLVCRIDRLGGSALGLHHLSKPVLFGQKLLLEHEGQLLDLGRVGEITRVDEGTLAKLSAAGVIPVLPSLALDAKGELLNVNADTVAAAVARELDAEKLVFISDTPGILLDAGDPSTLIRSLNEARCLELIKEGKLTGGMLPKVEACLESLKSGVKKIHLVDGRIRHSLLLEIYTEHGVGTEIVL